MKRAADIDQLLETWLDDGAEAAPERFVWAALDNVERTAQRGAWRTSLEGFLMNLKPAAPLFGIAAMVLLAIVAYSIFGGGNVGNRTVPTPTPRAFSVDELSTIVMTDANAPTGMAVDATTTGYEALTTPLRPGGEIIPLTGFVDALMTNLNSTDAGGYVSWSAVYETADQAARAFAFLVDEHEAEAGWGLQPSSEDPGLGDESRSYSGAAYQFDAANIYLWRVNILLLAAVYVDASAVGDGDANRLRAIAQDMDSRTR